MLNPWVLLGIAVVVVAASASSFLYGRNVGIDGERVKWQARETKMLAEANAKILTLTESARAQESLHAAELYAISAKYQEDLQREKTAADRIISDLRDGSRKLRISVAGPGQACRGEAGAAPATPGGRDGETRAELHPAAAEFLVGLTREADEIAHQLTACQAVIMQDRNNAER